MTPQSTGMRFELTEHLFDGWWTALPSTDRDEFTHAYGGSHMQARFVCALDYLTHVSEDQTDRIVRAYCLAVSQDYTETAHDFLVRTKAQAAYESAPVVRLMEMLQYRGARESEERIRTRTAKKLEDLYDRAEELEGDEQLKVEQMALTQSNMYLTRASKERAAHENRRSQEAMRDAVLAGKSRDEAALRPPSPQAALSYIRQLIEVVGEDVVRDALAPKQLNP